MILKSELVDLKKANDTPDKAKQLFLVSKEKINDKTVSNFDRAVAFYVVNKCSFSGLTESSSFSEQASNANFSLRGIQKLPEYSALISKWIITNYSYDYMMDGNKGAFMYLDPPYDIKDNLYGRKGINAQRI
jgi:site-specific DNA-adenine methylase